MKTLDKWLDRYFKARPQLNKPKKTFFKEYEMDYKIRIPFEALCRENEELREQLGLWKMVAEDAAVAPTKTAACEIRELQLSKEEAI